MGAWVGYSNFWHDYCLDNTVPEKGEDESKTSAIVDEKPTHSNQMVQNEEQQIKSNVKETLEPPTKKAKCEAGLDGVGHKSTSDDVVAADEADGKILTDNKKEAKAMENEDSSDSVSSFSSCESDKSKRANEHEKEQSGEFHKASPVVQPTIIDILKKSINELLNSLHRYYDVKWHQFGLNLGHLLFPLNKILLRMF